MSKLWGSRFKKGTNALADAFTFSIDYDQKLAEYDCLGSIAHAKMLGACKIIPKEDAKAIADGLKKILKQIKSEKFAFDPKAEDIHTNIQTALKKEIGAAADKLHTARSRNDQVVLDLKLYCLDQLSTTVRQIQVLQKSIVQFAETNKDVIIPAYTHLQSAQVVLLAHHMLAYVEMLDRDRSRMVDAIQRTNVLPLGSCALSGTSLPIDRTLVAEELAFHSVSRNSMDAVSDRDFVAEALFCLSMVAMHLSRMAEDLILWATAEFDFIHIDWGFCTGSSIMPHKKNPDVLELVRGQTGSIYADLQSVLVLLKGLPLTYNRDLQLDKPPLFDAVEKTSLTLELMTGLFKGITVNTEKTGAGTDNDALFSVDMVDYLIQKGMSYRKAHDTVGKIVRECLDKGKRIRDLKKATLKKYSAKFDEDVKDLFEAKHSVKIKQSMGSTNPKLVHKQIADWKKALKIK